MRDVLVGLTAAACIALASSAAMAKGPQFKVLKLSCGTGVISTTVANNTKTPVPEDAVITVHGVEAACTQTAHGPLAPKHSMKLPGRGENVRNCAASAKWELP